VARGKAQPLDLEFAADAILEAMSPPL